ncbi:MAG: hypothetical protein CVT67_11500 [Actinobacteria bacterium HGW-Actinobacteria-7]|nr:MAG: hypothetical protein CVT67_11500 [Actinobacteria bacterium HGW-Actinobacteria-7]
MYDGFMNDWASVSRTSWFLAGSAAGAIIVTSVLVLLGTLPGGLSPSLGDAALLAMCVVGAGVTVWRGGRHDERIERVAWRLIGVGGAVLTLSVVVVVAAPTLNQELFSDPVSAVATTFAVYLPLAVGMWLRIVHARAGANIKGPTLLAAAVSLCAFGLLAVAGLLPVGGKAISVGPLEIEALTMLFFDTLGLLAPALLGMLLAFRDSKGDWGPWLGLVGAGFIVLVGDAVFPLAGRSDFIGMSAMPWAVAFVVVALGASLSVDCVGPAGWTER